MNLIDLQLSEGLIKVPPKLVAAASSAVANAVLSQMASDIKSMYGPSTELNKFRLWARSAFRTARLTNVNLEYNNVTITLPAVATDDFDPRYQKSIPANTTYPTPTITFTNQPGHVGMYDAENDAIIISLAKAVSWPWEVYGKAIAGGERGQRLIDEIHGRISDYIGERQGTARHELMHYVQFNVLSHAHGDQVDQDDGDPTTDDQYYTSQTEFDPQIETAVSDTISLITKLNRNGISNSNIKNIAAYVVGAITRDQLTQTLGSDKMIPPMGSKFFATLKRTRPTQWKKAVRKFYNTLVTRLQ